MTQVAASTTQPSSSQSNAVVTTVARNPPQRKGGTKVLNGFPSHLTVKGHVTETSTASEQSRASSSGRNSILRTRMCPFQSGERRRSPGTIPTEEPLIRK
ncbi:hypothetical protein KIN20_023319 [Parelaphostrongylus tenuis]|uniref:Uncharacterized protein n=1 Tax=Parelaphostrongylus tenuis TaxID=148309 RepID=A0AAD5QVB7_PARTN|nr:hypothetical protein KIN20_023319 [Parelaphostrongylus tenuis]